MDNYQATYKIISLLLRYPEEDFVRDLQQMRNVILQHCSTKIQVILLDAISDFEKQQLLRIQELFTELFDFNSATSMNLTYHKFRDNRERGQALANLMDFYSQSGLEPNGTDLPDYLPLILEFCAISTYDTRDQLLTLFRSEISKLIMNLEQRSRYYSNVVKCIELIE